VAGVALLGFGLVYQGQEANLPRARTFAFCLVSYAFVAYAFSCRSQRYTLPQLGLFSNPYLFGAVAVSALLQLSVVTLPFAQPVFESAGHFAWEWGLLILLALAPVTVIEAAKILRARMGAGGASRGGPGHAT
jgi:Ca2+-transporting ATPase